MSTEEERASYSELFTIEPKAGRVRPSFPIHRAGMSMLHGAQYARPELSTIPTAFQKVFDNSQLFAQKFEAVVKIFVARGASYEMGSGFFVSPTVLCTAGHIGYLVGNKVAGFEAHIPSVDGARVAGYKLINVAELGRDWIEEYKSNYSTHAGGPLPPDTDPVLATTKPVAQCDFAFLQVKDEYKSKEYFTPEFNTACGDIAVYGYPGTFNTDNVRKKLKATNMADINVDYAFGSAVGDKQVAPGIILKDNNRILAHNASTLPGSSGSPVVNSANLKFVGIHIEASPEVDWNLSVSVNHPIFKAAYNEFVVPTLPAAS